MLTRILQAMGVGSEEITVYNKEWEQYRPLVYYANSILAREEGELVVGIRPLFEDEAGNVTYVRAEVTTVNARDDVKRREIVVIQFADSGEVHVSWEKNRRVLTFRRKNSTGSPSSHAPGSTRL
ncbi:hypothetical protein [Methanopyrus sp. SNP6]|uniref:hypothetical protein n=1 Tax=Methanopyrus sp. SNP6 TaxID=1937005 RepID=UPI0011E5DBD3|nr:hypothetical protein [Methanopyrus sp. SNP6]